MFLKKYGYIEFVLTYPRPGQNISPLRLILLYFKIAIMITENMKTFQ